MTHCEVDSIRRQPCGAWSRRRLELRSGRRLQTETLRLPPRDKHGEVRLISVRNGESSPEPVRETDQRRKIIAVFEEQFFDIGAGIPNFHCVPA